MELFCALLTGFFFWLFLCHWRHASLTRAREMGGALLLDVIAVGNASRTTLRTRILSVIGLLALFLLFGYFSFWRASPTGSFWLDNFYITMFVTGIFSAALPNVFRKDAPLELREHGVVRRRQSYENHIGRLTYTPWDEIPGCIWYSKLPKCYVHTQFLFLNRGALQPEEVRTITAVAGRFVPVYDVGGGLIAQPDAADETANPILRKSSGGGLRFQFNLQSILLLMVVVSCAASCYGIHDRSLQPQREAIAQLEVFHPWVSYSGDYVRWVSFSRISTVKPGDSDLIHLQRLRYLENLSLDNSPISDAGLKHLYPIKTLTSISLSYTNVTQKGIDDLQRELPNAHIFWSPSTPAPAKGQPRP